MPGERDSKNTFVVYAIEDGCPHTAYQHPKRGAVQSSCAAAPSGRDRASAGEGSWQHGSSKVGVAMLKSSSRDYFVISACQAAFSVRMDS